MHSTPALLQRYDQAINCYTSLCVSDPDQWHRSDTAEFTTLHSLLTPYAEAGDMRCQYALATICWLGLCCDNEDQYFAAHDTLVQEATRWWIAAASQGHWVALDNLLACGVGDDAERTKEYCRQFEQQHQSLIGHLHGMPVYGPEFVQELCRVLYGRVAKDLI